VSDPFHEYNAEFALPEGQEVQVSVTVLPSGKELARFSLPTTTPQLKLEIFRGDFNRIDVIADWIELPKES
jgi:hypothetical protein